VTPPRFDRDRIQAFLVRAGDRLDGDWLLVGGAAAAVWFASERSTEDIDLVCMEAVNSAADFFVRRIDGWQDHVVLLHRGARATIYRPDATLFILTWQGHPSDEECRQECGCD
jgi:hypothetical protein